ncbi:MAG: hypothetical protein P8J30_07730 [Ilumatobacter sp.]|nr:hypothetical protein [Ilumatobacter sp.]
MLSTTPGSRCGVSLLLFIMSLLPAGGASAQDRLLNTTGLDCAFTTISTGGWPEGAAGAEIAPSTLSLRFEEIDTDGATAEIVGPYGASQIIVRQTGDYLHLVQMFTVGPLYSTTVIDRETTDGRFMAVHTRHEYTDTQLIGFTSRPEQYYGDCAVEP